MLEAIAAEPEIDTPRLVFADWLEERGEGRRAEFIRVQCESNRLPMGSLEHLAMRQRVAELFDPAWLPAGWKRAPANQWGYDYEVGDAELLAAGGSDFVDLISTVNLALDPPPFAAESEALECARRLATSLMLRAAVGLNSHRTGPFAATGLAVLLASPHLANLRSLGLWGYSLGPAVLRALGAAPFRLRCLSLVRSSGDDGAGFAAVARLVATGPAFAGLEVLDLYENGLGPDDVAALVASPTLRPEVRLRWYEDEFAESAELYDALERRFDMG